MDSELFANIEYTAAWYYKHFPGFYNMECYNILANSSQNPQKYVVDDKGLKKKRIMTQNDDDESDEQ